MSCDFHQTCEFLGNYTCDGNCHIHICWSAISELQLEPDVNKVYKCDGKHYKCPFCGCWIFQATEISNYVDTVTEERICIYCHKKIDCQEEYNLAAKMSDLYCETSGL